MTTDTLIEVAPINTKQANEYNAKALELTTQAKQLTIKSQPDLERAADLRKTIKDMGKNLEEARKKITSPLDVARKAVMDLFRGPAEALASAEITLNKAITTYTSEQERLRLEAEVKLRRQAEAEEKRKREALEERARKAAEAGKAEKAEELLQKAAEVQVVAPTLAPTIQKVAGLSFRENWFAEVVDFMALVKAVAEGKAPMNFIMPNSTVLNSQARATKDSMIVPGVKFFMEKIPVGR